MTDFFIDDWDNGAVNGTLPGDITPYLDLITSEHRNLPNFVAVVTALLHPLSDIQVDVGIIPSLFDVDTAVGDQLDKIGEWVGVTRNVQVALTGVYFSLDSSTLGLDQGSMQGPDDPTSGVVVLPDSGYRTLLRARIAANHWDGSVPGAYAAWDIAFAGTGFSIGIVDLNTMHMLYVLFGAVPDALTLALFTGGELNLKPAGVHIDEYITPSNDNGPPEIGENDIYTKVLLHMDGVDGATAFFDMNAGGSPHTWTAADNAQIDTAQFKFGGASGLFDGAGDFITTPDSSDFELGSGDFTIDFWFNVNAAGGTFLSMAGQIDSAVTPALSSFLIVRTNTNIIFAEVLISGSGVSIFGTTQFTNALNTGWHHLAFVRTGNTLKLFIDGVQEGGDLPCVGTVNNSAQVLGVGCLGGFVPGPMNGWIDEFRMSVGIARWTANFTPPTQAYRQHAYFGLDSEDLQFVAGLDVGAFGVETLGA